MPDTFLDRADEVVNVDVTVEELQSRLRQGKVYRAEKVEQALANFFRETNISTLRELAMRAVADEIGEKAASRRQREGLEPPLIPERVMVCMSSALDAPRVIRAGARVASRLGARWYAVYVETPHEAPGHIGSEDRDALQRNLVLAEELGATIVRVKADKPADGLIAFAKHDNGAYAALSGSRIITLVPPLGGQSIAIWPAWASISRFAVGRPRPDPRDLVVKNGVKILSRMSAGMPGPLSVKATELWSPSPWSCT